MSGCTKVWLIVPTKSKNMNEFPYNCDFDFFFFFFVTEVFNKYFILLLEIADPRNYLTS